MNEPWLDQALMESAYTSELSSDIQTNKQAPWNPALSGWFSIKVNPLNFKLGQIGPGVQELWSDTQTTIERTTLYIYIMQIPDLSYIAETWVKDHHKVGVWYYSNLKIV